MARLICKAWDWLWWENREAVIFLPVIFIVTIAIVATKVVEILSAYPLK